jgi:diphthamide synthase subunit DPH2
MEESNEKMEALVKKRYKQIQVLEEELSEAIHFKMRTREERLKLADKLEKYLRKLEYIIEN